MSALQELEIKAPLTELELCVVMAGTLCDNNAAAKELSALRSELSRLETEVEVLKSERRILNNALTQYMEEEQ